MLLNVRRQVFLQQEPRPAENRIERVSELVGDGRQELVIGTIGDLGLFARMALALEQDQTFFFELFFRRDVESDAKPFADAAVRVREGYGARLHPDVDAVLATHAKFGLEIASFPFRPRPLDPEL